MRSSLTETEPGSPTRQPPYVLAAWVEEQLADVRNVQVQRVVQLGTRLRTEAFDWDNTDLAESITALHAAGRDLRFLELRHGWVSGALGRYKAAYARFVAAYERIRECARAVEKHAAALADPHPSQISGARLALVDLDIECKSMGGDVDQGVGWLQDLCAQLSDAKTKGDSDPQLETFAEKAQVFTRTFKQLQTVGAMAHEIVTRGNSVLRRRLALLEQVRADLECFDKVWLRRLVLIATDAKAGRAAISGIPKAIDAHDDWMKRLSATVDACTALKHEEHLLGEHLAMLHEELQESMR
jgi:hypothetical protein